MYQNKNEISYKLMLKNDEGINVQMNENKNKWKRKLRKG